MIEILKSYVILLLLVLVVSYLAPKDTYKKYMQFFIGAWMCMLLLKPVLNWIGTDMTVDWEGRIQIPDEILQVEKWQGEEVDIFELFYRNQTEE